MTLEEHFALVRDCLHDPEPLESLAHLEHALNAWRAEAELTLEENARLRVLMRKADAKKGEGE